MKRIDRIVIEHVEDPHGDSSHLGEYSDTPGEFAIDRKCGGNEYRYFNAANVSNMKEARENYKRAERLNNGHWHYIGIRAVAYVSTSAGGAWQSHKLASHGLWGTESDGGHKYHREIAAEEISTLTDILLDFGFTAEQVSAAAVVRGEVCQVRPIPVAEQYTMSDA
jgi:hypothetical protein